MTDSESHTDGYKLGASNAALDHNRGKPAPGAVSIPSKYLGTTERGKTWDGWTVEANEYVQGYQDGWNSVLRAGSS